MEISLEKLELSFLTHQIIPQIKIKCKRSKRLWGSINYQRIIKFKRMTLGEIPSSWLTGKNENIQLICCLVSIIITEMLVPPCQPELLRWKFLNFSSVHAFAGYFHTKWVKTNTLKFFLMHYLVKRPKRLKRINGYTF